MSLYELDEDRFRPIPTSTFIEKQIKERDDLQRLLKQQIDILSPDLLVLAEEFGNWEGSNRRIDILALDKDANFVVIELKRTTSGGHMELQALRYAAMVSTMTFLQACNAYKNYLESNNIKADAEKNILEFLDWQSSDESEFGNDVKIILVSGDFSKEITTTALWLNERGLDIRCIKLNLYDMDGHTLVDVQQIIPLPEAELYQIKVREKSRAVLESRLSKRKWNIERLLKTIREKEGYKVAEIAKEIYEWSSKVSNEIWWSDAKIDGSFIPIFKNNTGEEFWFFALRSTGKIELYLGVLANKPPFDAIENRHNLIDRINELGADIPLENSKGYPKFPLSLLENPKKMEAFKKTIEWAYDLTNKA